MSRIDRLIKDILIKDSHSNGLTVKLGAIYPSLDESELLTSTSVLTEVFYREGYEELKDILHGLREGGDELVSRGIKYNETVLCDALSGLSYEFQLRMRGVTPSEWAMSDMRAICLEVMEMTEETGIFKYNNYTNPFRNGYIAEAALAKEDLDLFKIMTSDWNDTQVIRTLTESEALFLPIKVNDIDAQYYYIDLFSKEDIKSMKSDSLDGLIVKYWSNSNSIIESLTAIEDKGISERVFRFCTERLNIGSIYRKKQLIGFGGVRDIIKGITSLAEYAKVSGVTFNKKDIKNVLKPFDLLCKATGGNWESVFSKDDQAKIASRLKVIFSDIDPSIVGRHQKETLIGLKNALNDSRWIHSLNKNDRRDVLLDDLGV